MKLKKEEVETYSSGYKEEKRVRAKISIDNLGYVLDGLIKIYKTPINSIVREITSNCFDSHMEAGVDTPVFVGFGEDDNYEPYVYFKDQGLGLSEDEMNNIYMEYANSTKRDKDNIDGDEDKVIHGAFGIGSKSPFAYRDDFYIISVKDGIRTEYHNTKENDERIDDLIKELEYEVDEPNGVEIRIFLKSKYDKQYFERAFKEELVYFDNVYFQNCEVDNNYKIYEYRTFKFRSDIASNSKMHICYGRAKYPINWNLIGRDAINLPIGIKIPMGELEPIRSREDVKYTEESIKIINEYINACLEEIKTLYSKEQQTIYDIFEYKPIRYEKGNIKIDEGLYLDTREVINDYKYKYYLADELNVKSVNFNIEELFSEIYQVSHRIVDGRRTTKFNYFNWDVLFYRTKKEYKNENLKNKFINNGNIIRKKPNFKPKKFYNDMVHLFNLQNDEKGSKLKKVGIIYRDLRQHMLKFSKPYSKIVIPEEFIEANKINRGRLDKTKIIVHKVNSWSSSYRKSPKKDWKKEVTIEELNKFKGLLIYGSKEDERLLESISEMFPHSIKNSDMYLILHTSKSNQRHFHLLNNCNCIHIDKFMEGRNRAFIKCATAHKISKMLDTFNKYSASRSTFDSFTTTYKKRHDINSTYTSATNMDMVLKLLNENIYNHLMELRTYVNNSFKITDSKVVEGMLEVCEQNNLFDLSITDSYDTVVDYVKGLDLLFYTHLTPDSIEHVILYAKRLGKKLNLKHYTVLTEDYELELYTELQTKKKYLELVKNNDPEQTWDKIETELKQILKIA